MIQWGEAMLSIFEEIELTYVETGGKIYSDKNIRQILQSMEKRDKLTISLHPTVWYIIFRTVPVRYGIQKDIRQGLKVYLCSDWMAFSRLTLNE
jgi:hypothetical protein